MRNILFGGALLSALCVFSEMQTWRADPADAVWNTTSSNWEGGTVWTNGNAAVFGASSEKTISVGGDIVFTNMQIQADGYTFAGPGSFVLADGLDATRVTVGSDCSAVFSTAMTNPVPSIPFVKQGAGTLTLSGTTTVARLHVAEGTLRLVSNTVNAAWIRVSNTSTKANLLLDGVDLHVVGGGEGNVVIGDVGAFQKAQLGAGPVTIRSSYSHTIAQALSTADGIEQDGGIVKSGLGNLVFSGKAGQSTFRGGIRVQVGQLRLTGGIDELDVGPIAVVGDSPFFTDADTTVRSKVVFASATPYVGSTGLAGGRMTLTSVGTSGQNASHQIGLGRSSGNPSVACLALTQTNSEAVSQIRLRGKLDLAIDGGVIKARSDAATPFFDCSQMNTDHVAQVTRNGFAFDAEAGANVALGLTLKLAEGFVTTNYPVVAGAFANPSFETDFTGWSYGRATGAESVGNPQKNSSGFTPTSDLQTTNGAQYAVLRRENWMSSPFTVPTQGLWSVCFEMGCRGTNYRGYLIPVTVTIDDAVVLEIGERAHHPFTLFTTVPQVLAAGTHTLKVTTGSGTVTNDSLLFDAFRLAAAEVVVYPMAPVVKLGEGALSITNLVTDGRVVVSNGTLALADFALDGAAVSVASNAVLNLGCGVLTNATLTVAKDGCLELGTGANLIVNGDFEQEVVCQAAGYEQHTPTGWTLTMLNGQSNYSGYQRNGSSLSSDAEHHTPSGSQTAFVRSRTRFSTAVTVTQAGTYRLSFLYAARKYGDSYALPLYVEVDGVTNWTMSGESADYGFRAGTTTFDLTAGSHTIAFEVGGSRNYECLFLDAIKLALCDQMPTFSATRIDLAAGSTLSLENGARLDLAGDVFIEGVKFTGGRRRLAQRGVIVVGEGAIQVGPPDGTVLIVR